MGTGRHSPRLGMDVQPELSRAREPGRPPADRDDQRAHLPARPAGHRRRRRAQRLRGRGGQAAGPARHRGGDLHPRGLPGHPARAGARTRGAGQEPGGRSVRGTRQELAARADLPVHVRRAAHRGRLRARPVRPGARALLAVRPGRGGGRGALGGALGAIDAHPRQGQEPGPGQRRLRRARGQDPGRGRGRGGRRPAGREHRGRGAAAGRAVRRHAVAGEDGVAGGGPVGVPAWRFWWLLWPASGGGSGWPPTRSCWCSRAGSSR